MVSKQYYLRVVRMTRIICVNLCILSILTGIVICAFSAQELQNKYFQFLITALGSSDIAVRTEAIRLISDVCDKTDKRVLHELKKLLKSDSAIIRIEAAKAIAKFGDASGIPVLLQMLKERQKILDSDTPVRRAIKFAKNLNRVKAIEALGEVGIKNEQVLSALTEISNSKDEDGTAVDAATVSLIKLGKRDLTKVFIYGLLSSDIKVRAKACEILGEVKEDKAKARIRELLKHYDKNVRRSACLALGKIGAKEYIEEIKKLLNDKEEIVKISACESLGLLGEKSSVNDLKKMLDDRNGFVRLAAYNALFSLGENPGMSFVLSVANSTKPEDLDAVLKSIRILYNFGDRTVIDQLETAFNNQSSELVKVNIAGAILKILSNGGKTK